MDYIRPFLGPSKNPFSCIFNSICEKYSIKTNFERFYCGQPCLIKNATNIFEGKKSKAYKVHFGPALTHLGQIMTKSKCRDLNIENACLFVTLLKRVFFISFINVTVLWYSRVIANSVKSIFSIWNNMTIRWQRETAVVGEY